MDKWPPENEVYKVKIFTSALGNKALIKYYNRFQLTEQDSVKNIIEAIKKKLSSKKNVIYDRPMFNSCNQWKNETFDEYLLKLNKLVEKCEFNSFKDDLLRDKVVLGIKNKELHNKLMTKADLTLEKAIDSCKVEELTKKRMKDIPKKKEDSYVRKNHTERKNCGKCLFCENSHQFKKDMCPAFGKSCSNCKGKYYFAIVCKKPKTNNNKQKGKELVTETNSDHESNNSDNVFEINKIIDNSLNGGNV